MAGPENINVEGWQEYRQLVLAELSRISSEVRTLNAKFDSDANAMKIEIAVLKTKNALYAGLVGLVTSTIVATIVAAMVGYIFKR